MEYQQPFGCKTWSRFWVAGTFLVEVVYFEDENTKIIVEKTGYYARRKTISLDYKMPASKRFKKAWNRWMDNIFPCCCDHTLLGMPFEGDACKYEELDWEYNEEVGFVDRAVEVFVEALKRRPVERLIVTAHETLGQELLFKELQKRGKISTELLQYVRSDESEFGDKILELIDYHFYYGIGKGRYINYKISNEMLGKDFLALHHIISNPEVLKDFTGRSLAIGYGTENGFDHTFVLRHFKQWLAGDPVQFTFLQVSDGSIPSEEEMQFLQENADRVYHNESKEPPAEYVFQFVRSKDGSKAEILLYVKDCAFITDSDDSKRGFFWNFRTASDPCPRDGSLKNITRIK